MRVWLLLLAATPVAAVLNLCSSKDESSNGHTFARMEKDCRDFLLMNGNYDHDIVNSERDYAKNGCPFWDDRDKKNVRRRCVVMKIAGEGGVAKWFYKDEMNAYTLAATACDLTLLEAQAVLADAASIYGSIGFNGRPLERHRQASAINSADGAFIDLPEPLVGPFDAPGTYSYDGESDKIFDKIVHERVPGEIVGVGGNSSRSVIVSENGFNRVGFNVKQAKVYDQIPASMHGKSRAETRGQNYHMVSAPYSSIHAPDEKPPRHAPKEVQETWSEEEMDGITRVLQQFRCSLVKAMELGFDKSFEQIAALDRIDELRVKMTSECFWDVVEDFCGNYIPMVTMSMVSNSAKLYLWELVDNFYNPEQAVQRIMELQKPLYKPLLDEYKAGVEKVLSKYHDDGRKLVLTEKELKRRDAALKKLDENAKKNTYLQNYNGVVEDARRTGCGKIDDTVKMPDACVREHVLRAALPPYMGFPYASTQDGKKWAPSSQVWRGMKQVLSPFNQTSHRWHTNRATWGDQDDGFPGIPINRPGDIVGAFNVMVNHCQKTKQGQICWAFTSLLKNIGEQKQKELKKRCKDIRQRRVTMRADSACDAILGGVNPGENEGDPRTDLSECDDLFGDGKWYTSIEGFWQITSGAFARFTNNVANGVLDDLTVDLIFGAPDPKVERNVTVTNEGTCKGTVDKARSNHRTVRFDLSCVFGSETRMPKMTMKSAASGAKIAIQIRGLLNGDRPVTLERGITSNIDISSMPPQPFLMARAALGELETTPLQQQDGCSKPNHWCLRGTLDRVSCTCTCDEGFYGESCEFKDRCGIVYHWMHGTDKSITIPGGGTVGPIAKKTLSNELIEASLFARRNAMPSDPFAAMAKRLGLRPNAKMIEDLKIEVLNDARESEDEQERIANILTRGAERGAEGFQELLKQLQADQRSGREEETLAKMDRLPEMEEVDPEKSPCWEDVQISLRNEVRRWQANAEMSDRLRTVLGTDIAGKEQRLRKPVDMAGEVTQEDIKGLPVQLKVFTMHLATVQCILRLIQENVPVKRHKEDASAFISMGQSSVSLGEELPFNFKAMYPVRVISPGVHDTEEVSGSVLMETEMMQDVKASGARIKPHCPTGDCDFDQSEDVLKISEGMASLPKTRAYRNRIRQKKEGSDQNKSQVLLDVSARVEEAAEVKALQWPEEENEQPKANQPRLWDCRSFSGSFLACGDRVQLTQAARKKQPEHIAQAAYSATITARTNNKDKLCLTKLDYKFSFNSEIGVDDQRRDFAGCFAKEDLERYKPQLPLKFKSDIFIEGYHHVCDCSNPRPRANDRVCTLKSRQTFETLGFDKTSKEFGQICASDKAPDHLERTMLTADECEWYVPADKRRTRGKPSCDAWYTGWEWHFGNPRDPVQRGFFLNRCTGVTMWPPSYKRDAEETPPPWVEEEFRGSMYLEWEPLVETPPLLSANKWLTTVVVEADVGWKAKISCEKMRAMQWAFHRTDIKSGTDSEGRPGSEAPPGLDEKIRSNYICNANTAGECDKEWQNVLMLYKRNTKNDAEKEYFDGLIGGSVRSSRGNQAALASFAGSKMSDGKTIAGQNVGSGSYSKTSKYGLSIASNFLHSVLWESLSQGLLYILSKGCEFSGSALSALGRGLAWSGNEFVEHLWTPYLLPALQGAWGLICFLARWFYNIFIWAPSIWAPSAVSEFSVWSAGKSEEFSTWLKQTESYLSFAAGLKVLGDWFSDIGTAISDNLSMKEGTKSRAVWDASFKPISNALYDLGYFVIVTFLAEFVCKTVVWGSIQGTGRVLSKLGEWSGSAISWLVKGSGTVISKLGEWTGSAISNTALAIKYVIYDLFSYAFVWKMLNSEAAYGWSVEVSQKVKAACDAFSTACGVWSHDSRAAISAKITNSIQVCRAGINDSIDVMTPYWNTAKESAIRTATYIGKVSWHVSASTWNSIMPSALSLSHGIVGTLAGFLTLVSAVISDMALNVGWSVVNSAKSLVTFFSLSQSTSDMWASENAPGTKVTTWWRTVESFWPDGPYKNVEMPMPEFN